MDTVLLCSVTALAILVSDSGPNAFGADGVRTAQAAFSSVLGDWAGGIFAVSVLFFGVATIFCWAHYGMMSVRVILPIRENIKRIAMTAFRWLFALSVVAGSVVAPAGVWSMADGALGIMTIINLIVLLLLHREVVNETRRFMEKN